MPEKKFKNARGRISTFLFFLPSALILLFPAKDIGRMVSHPPAFAVPDSVVAGEPLSWKDNGEIAAIRMNGRPLMHVMKPDPFYLGVADNQGPSAFNMDVVYASPHLEVGQKIKRFFKPKTRHPEVPYFTKLVKVDSPQLEDEDDDNVRRPAAALPGERPFEPALRTLLAKADGVPNISCWKAPEMKFQEPPPTLPGRKPMKKRPTFSITAAGPGEVVFVGDSSVAGGSQPQEKTVLLYHGGGIFSRYLKLKDFRVRKGEKVKAGQELGSMSFASQKEASHAEAQWEVRWGTTAVTPPSFLALSSQLCGST